MDGSMHWWTPQVEFASMCVHDDDDAGSWQHMPHWLNLQSLHAEGRQWLDDMGLLLLIIAPHARCKSPFKL